MADDVRLVTVVLEVRDLAKAVDLYRDGFGLDLQPSDHRGAAHGEGDRWISGEHAAISWHESSYLHFALYEAKQAATTGAQVSFRVDDIEAAHRRAVAAGAAVLHEPRSEPWGRSARYRDHDGNVVELTQPV